MPICLPQIHSLYFSCNTHLRLTTVHILLAWSTNISSCLHHTLYFLSRSHTLLLAYNVKASLWTKHAPLPSPFQSTHPSPCLHNIPITLPTAHTLLLAYTIHSTSCLQSTYFSLLTIYKIPIYTWYHSSSGYNVNSPLCLQQLSSLFIAHSLLRGYSTHSFLGCNMHPSSFLQHSPFPSLLNASARSSLVSTMQMTAAPHY